MSEFMKGQKKIEKNVVSSYRKIEDTVVSGYRKIEDGFVGGYKRIENSFVNAFLAPDEAASPQNDQFDEALPSDDGVKLQQHCF